MFALGLSPNKNGGKGADEPMSKRPIACPGCMPHTNSPNWSLCISLKNYNLRVEERPKHYVFITVIDLRTFCIDKYC